MTIRISYSRKAFSIATVLSLLFVNSNALNNGVGLTPAMGWNTWNKYGCNINADIIKSNADRIIQLGLDRIGYVYVNIDDCWQLAERDENGRIKHDETKFPGGMKVIGDYLHLKNLKFGLYSSAGTKSCQRLAGSLGHEEEDAADFAMVGVDYLKYDNQTCNIQIHQNVIGFVKNWTLNLLFYLQLG